MQLCRSLEKMEVFGVLLQSCQKKLEVNVLESLNLFTKVMFHPVQNKNIEFVESKAMIDISASKTVTLRPEKSLDSIHQNSITPA